MKKILRKALHSILDGNSEHVRLANTSEMRPSALSAFYAEVHRLANFQSFDQAYDIVKRTQPHLFHNMLAQEAERKRLEKEARETDQEARRNPQLANSAVMSVIPIGLRTMCGLPQNSSDAEVRAKYAQMMAESRDTMGVRLDTENESVSTNRTSSQGRDIPVVNPASALFAKAVKSIMAESGVSYSEAWQQAKRDYSDLYARMLSTSGKGAHSLH